MIVQIKVSNPINDSQNLLNQRQMHLRFCSISVYRNLLEQLINLMIGASNKIKQKINVDLNQQRIQYQAYKQKKMNETVGFNFCFFFVLLILQTPFIVCDLVFANNGNCADDDLKGFAITLQDWLRVDGIGRIVIVGVALTSTIVGIFRDQRKVSRILMFIISFYAVFELAWILTGSVLYWNRLDPEKLCDAQLIGYMYAVLILGFFTFFALLLPSLAQANKL